MMLPYPYVQPVAELRSSLGFTVWGVGQDDVVTVLAPDYFGAKAEER